MLLYIEVGIKVCITYHQYLRQPAHMFLKTLYGLVPMRFQNMFRHIYFKIIDEIMLDYSLFGNVYLDKKNDKLQV